uniref:Uncharacterized protein n=1 Tax=Rhizophora mucronata TaxID=61149 RepID=A0A2P2NPM8_RHIMU
MFGHSLTMLFEIFHVCDVGWLLWGRAG